MTRLMLEMQLQHAGYTTIGVGSGEAALDQLARERFDLLITDLRLPDMDGLQVIAEARAIDPEIAVIILTGSASTTSAVAALNQQVHRYLLKPILPDELVRAVVEVLARQRRLAERAQSYHTQRADQGEDHVLRVGPLRIDPYRHRVTYSGQPLVLSSGEFSLLLYLTRRRGIVVSAQEIAREVLRYPCSQEEARNLTKSRIHSLRQKIEGSPCAARLIHNVRGAGYRLLDDDELEGFPLS
ncbi:MAG: response regulator transcription factor, partial [Oscillochloris sp.]|nr:response regulator transcription factor [Oscillochloris sp.]